LSESEVKPTVEMTVEEREPTPEELQLMAAKQLLIELQMIKRRIYESGTLMNGMLIMQVKFLLNGLMKKYHDAGVLLGENVALKMGGRGKHASMFFEYTPGLKTLIQQVVDALPKPEATPEVEQAQ
jgi:hypothetical protein